MAEKSACLWKKFLQLLLVFNALIYSVDAELAIIHAIGPRGIIDACALYNPHFGSIPQKLKHTAPFLAYMPSDTFGCSDYHDLDHFWNATSFVYAGNCSNFEKLTKAQQSGAKQVIIVSKTGSDYPHGTKDQFNYIHIPVGMILESSWNKVQSLGQPLVVQFWHPHDPLFDPNLIIIWILAVFSILLGAYWSGVTTLERMTQEEDNTTLDNTDEDKDNLQITPVTIVVFLGLICSVLLLLYFFYKYLIYAVIGLFSIAALNGMFDCMRAILSKISCCGTCKTPQIPYLKRSLEYRMIILFFVCLGVVVWWIIERHATYSWIIQDFLGVCFCISLIKLIKLPNLKVSVFLLVALLVYDIFFVFITPLFSARGKSIMVEVATGKGSSEQLPMVIRVPKLIKSALSLCERPYSLLGFGDILLPGLFVGFCRNFDIVAEIPKSLYFVASMIGYGCGLIITFIALVYMKSGQPALLYLVPGVLIPVILVSLMRKEFKSIWHGRVKLDPKDSGSSGSVENAPVDIEPKSVNTQRSNELLPLLDPENRPK